MKALVISDDDKVLSFIDSNLKQKKIDSINYKWLIKALDNLEEIHPDLIIINVCDYPRHWKTLAQFVITTFKERIRIVLYVSDNFSDEEKNKAKALGIDDIYNSLDLLIDNLFKLDSKENNFDEKLNLQEDFTLFTVDNLLTSFDDVSLFTCDNLIEAKEVESVKHWGSLLKKIQGSYEK